MLAVVSRLHEHRDLHEIPQVHAIEPEWLVPSDSYGRRAVLRNVLPLLVLLWMAPLLARWNAAAPWLLGPVIGLFLYRITVVMHDCTHRTLFVNRRTNSALGLLLGAVSGVDFDSFCRQHWRHHRRYGRDGDPQGFQYFELGRMTRREMRWHIVKPLLGLNLRNVLVESIAAPGNVARMLRTGEFAIVALVQLAMLALVTGFGRYPVLAALPLLSGATFGLFFSQLRGIAEHGGAGDSYLVRSHQSRWLDRIFLYDVNFNYHAEHHAQPHIPSCHLAALHETVSAAGTSTSVSMLETVRAIYQASEARRV